MARRMLEAAKMPCAIARTRSFSRRADVKRPAWRRRPLYFAPIALVALASAGCIGSGTGGGNDADEIDCSGITCDWSIREGTPVFGATWHEGDLGIDLSSPGRQVIELRDVLFASHSDRQLILRSVLVRDPTASITFEIDFYAVGQGPGRTFWDRSPVFLVTRHLEVTEQAVTALHRPVLVPSEGAAVVLRIVKDGVGRAMIDEVTLGR